MNIDSAYSFFYLLPPPKSVKVQTNLIQRDKHGPADLAVPSLIPEVEIFSTIKAVFSTQLSLTPSHSPDMSEIPSKQTVNRKSFIHLSYAKSTCSKKPMHMHILIKM